MTAGWVRFSQLEDALRQRTNHELQRPPPGGWDLERMRRLVAALGHPHRDYPVVHVAGTTGKGTTAAAVASALSAAGLRVGLTTSPHLIDLRERIRIGARPAEDDVWLAAAARVLSAADEARLEPTYFEVVTAVALQAFRQERVDAAVVEVGLGGRLDATNVVEPSVSVITPIALDHTRLLGPDLRSIAAEKAGILRAGVPAAAAPGSPAAEEVIRERAEALGTPLLLVGRDAWVELCSPGPSPTPARLRTPWGDLEVELPMPAEHAADALLAALAVQLLGQRLGRPLEAGLRLGLRRLRWRGRFDVLPGQPPFVVDGAHDPTSIAALVSAYRVRFPALPAVLLIAVAEDKALEEMVAALQPIVAEAICCAVHEGRATPPGVLAERLGRRGILATACDSFERALSAAEARAAALSTPLLVTGSLYLAGRVLAQRGVDPRAAWEG